LQYCEPCAWVGFYKKDCGGGYPGECVACTGLPSGGVWTTHGWYNNSCEFECRGMSYRQNLLCYMNVSLASTSVLEMSTSVLEMSTSALDAKSHTNVSLTAFNAKGHTNVSPVMSMPVLDAKRSSSNPGGGGLGEVGALLVGVACAGAGSMLLVVVCAVICSSMSAKSKAVTYLRGCCLVPAGEAGCSGGSGSRFRSFNGVQMSTKY